MTSTIPRPRCWAAAGAALIFTVGVTACGGDDDDAIVTATPTDSAAPAEQPAESSEEADRGGPGSVELPEGASLLSIEVGEVTVHAYLGVTGLNGNYVVESESAVIVVDTSFQDPDVPTLRAIADSVGKPIERVLITHAHPDHVGGLNTAFADIPVATTATVAASIDAGDREIEILDGSFTIDGVEYVATEFLDAEAESQMIVTFDDGDAIFVGDLVYNGTHLVLSPNLESWIGILEELQIAGASTILPGHGSVADASVYQANIDYLQTVIDILPTVSTVDEYTAALLQAYPDLPGEFFIDIYAAGLLDARGG